MVLGIEMLRACCNNQPLSKLVLVCNLNRADFLLRLVHEPQKHILPNHRHLIVIETLVVNIG